jgi:hypothetical protein
MFCGAQCGARIDDGGGRAENRAAMLFRRRSEDAGAARRRKKVEKALAWERKTLQNAGDRASELIARTQAERRHGPCAGTLPGQGLIVVHGRHRSWMGVHDQDGALVALVVPHDGVFGVHAHDGRLLGDAGQALSGAPVLFSVELARRQRAVPFTVRAPDGTVSAVAHRDGLDGASPKLVEAYGSRYRRHPVTDGETLIAWVAIAHRPLLAVQYERDWFVEDEAWRPKARIIWASHDRARPGFVATFESHTSQLLRQIAIAAMIGADHERGYEAP